MSQTNFKIPLTKRRVTIPGLGEIIYSLVDFPDPDNSEVIVMRMDYSIHTEVGETLSDSAIVKEGEEVEIIYDRTFWIGTLEK